MSVFEQLRGTLAASLGVTPDTIRTTTRQVDLPKWDSLAHIDLITAAIPYDVLRDTYQFMTKKTCELDKDLLMLEVEDFAKLTSVAAILSYLQSRGIE